MSGRFAKSLLVPVAMLAAFLAMNVALVWAQHGSEGTVTVTVLDPSGSVIPGAQLELRDLATNNVRKVQTQANGTYTFVNLLVGKYRLTVTQVGFKSQAYNEVEVQAAQTTNISATLKVGGVNETVEVVTDQAPLLETT